MNARLAARGRPRKDQRAELQRWLLDPDTKPWEMEVLRRRLAGESWKTIGEGLCVSPERARQLYGYPLRRERAREVMRLRSTDRDTPEAFYRRERWSEQTKKHVQRLRRPRILITARAVGR